MNKGEQTRQKIIAEAAPIFNQRGYAGCSMQDILNATGLEKGGLYRHFASKEELAVEAFRYALLKAVKIRTDGLDAIPGARRKLRHVVRRFTEGPSVLPGGCPLMNTAVDADDGNLALRALVREGILDWKLRLVHILDEGIEAGEIDPAIQPRRVANIIIATLEGALMISRVEADKEALRDARLSLNALIADLARQGRTVSPRKRRQRRPA